jgi:hypothetical protein
MAFTASQLLKVQTVADDLWMDNRAKTDYIAECDVAKAIQSETTAILSPLQDPAKTKIVKLIWLNACDVTDAAVGDDCAITGPELTSDSEDYTIDIFRKTSFSVKEIQARTDEFTLQQQIARGILQCDKVLSEYLAEQCVSKLESYRGTNTYLSPLGSTAWSLNGSDTEIPANQWTPALMPKLSLTARKNKILNPALISGEALWYINEEAANDSGNSDGKGDATRIRKYFDRKYFDPVKIDEVNAGTFKVYMVDRGAMALVTKSHYPTAPVTYQNPWQMRYQVESKNLPGIFWEVTYSNSCTSSEITHVWQFKVNAGIFLNPTGCTSTNTGVLSFVRPEGV